MDQYHLHHHQKAKKKENDVKSASTRKRAKRIAKRTKRRKREKADVARVSNPEAHLHHHGVDVLLHLHLATMMIDHAHADRQVEAQADPAKLPAQ